MCSQNTKQSNGLLFFPLWDWPVQGYCNPMAGRKAGAQITLLPRSSEPPSVYTCNRHAMVLSLTTVPPLFLRGAQNDSCLDLDLASVLSLVQLRAYPAKLSRKFLVMDSHIKTTCKHVYTYILYNLMFMCVCASEYFYI